MKVFLGVRNAMVEVEVTGAQAVMAAAEVMEEPVVLEMVVMAVTGDEAGTGVMVEMVALEGKGAKAVKVVPVDTMAVTVGMVESSKK
ncbi:MULTISPECIES: hypothetical protein [Enterobacter]|uniref:Uncharacterized protein n=1 Tax=Enterobacter ludwigii TaxID=299767 RepID=A0AAX3LDW2_9ENTR|nr:MULTISPECIES: hypothetical protein [Enterobacter]EKS7423587.1 hypothetical protein [Enterobacter ludwigii]ELN9423403.1 hypothetical protein [Enterobacter ludwigii]ELP5693104.1 hypothetical protein [Enterobacter ludwigii]EMD2742976.1 hypothetical protein [Enterobacter ludwigii]KUQ43034.1 hypothetical protein AWI16_02625 [Enterobacter ludwigii]